MKCIVAKAMFSSINIATNVDSNPSLRDIQKEIQLIQI